MRYILTDELAKKNEIIEGYREECIPFIDWDKMVGGYRTVVDNAPDDIKSKWKELIEFENEVEKIIGYGDEI